MEYSYYHNYINRYFACTAIITVVRRTAVATFLVKLVTIAAGP